MWPFNSEDRPQEDQFFNFASGRRNSVHLAGLPRSNLIHACV